jgi:hypothetical protein
MIPRYIDLVFTACLLSGSGCETATASSEPPTRATAQGYQITTAQEQIAELCEAVKVLNGNVINADVCFIESDDKKWTLAQSVAADRVTRFILECGGEK